MYSYSYTERHEGQRFLYRSLKILRGVRLIYSGLIEYIVHTREKKHLFGLLMNGKFVVKKQGRQNIFPSAGARGLTSSCTLPPAPPSMKKLRSKGLYLVISLRHFGVTWEAYARCWSLCLQYCEWILPFFKGNLQHHHFIFTVYYQGRKVSSSFLWLTSFFFHSLVVFLLTCSMKLPHQQPMLPAPPTKGQNEGVTCAYCTLPPVSFVLFFLISLTLNTVTNAPAHVM